MNEPALSGNIQTILKVSENQRLLEFLYLSFPDRSRKSVKSLLTQKKVCINEKIITRFDFKLSEGMQIFILKKSGVETQSIRKIKILYEDEAVIVIEKPSGLLSVSTNNEKTETAFGILREWSKHRDHRSQIFVVHRLDRDTSGVMMFTKSHEIQQELQHNWKKAISMRIYFAVVEGRLKKPQGEIVSWLKENKGLSVYSSRTPGDGQKAITHYRVLKTASAYSLLKLKLETGRKNQIRVHLQNIGHSIAGDNKYGAQTNPIRRLALHAGLLEFIHPETGKKMRFESPVPARFYKCLN